MSVKKEIVFALPEYTVDDEISSAVHIKLQNALSADFDNYRWHYAYEEKYNPDTKELDCQSVNVYRVVVDQDLASIMKLINLVAQYAMFLQLKTFEVSIGGEVRVVYVSTIIGSKTGEKPSEENQQPDMVEAVESKDCQVC